MILLKIYTIIKWGEFTEIEPENDDIEDDQTDDREENVEDRVEPEDVHVDIPVISPKS